VIGIAVVMAAVRAVSPSDVLVQAIKSVIVVSALLVGFRLFGKREMSQLTVYDLAMLFALSNAVQNAMTGGRGNFAVGLATSSSIVVAAWALTRIIIRHPGLEGHVLGSPTILVHNGRVLKERLRHALVTSDELDAAIRGYGIDSPSGVALAVLEVDGSISVVPREAGAHESSASSDS
jgi:uncharacterized membrane protein YcaP (DUF421 family)